ncbi:MULTISPECIES: hypothetical protein [unclassified Gordonia (in: high G+C Gram-positive bacteria)]|uniref:hypothetical protein n=1 Tax=unclassified Gordonia (in: high G+C Gram-positive bacteria) TaxID=2657482 RepID=UPI000990B6BA|nr:MULTISPECIES: hypothetical protein [unclassified Gordonia (in: high G+C Gram-positive bacteria)]MCX2755317.1 hypothetical protein [Gordonia sp. 4N]
MSKAHTDAEAIAAVKRALAQYAERVGPTAASAQREMSAISEQVTFFIEECNRAIRRLEDAIKILESQEDPDEAQLREKRRQLRIWMRRHLDTKHLQAQLTRDHDTFRGHQHRYANAIEPLAERGAQRMRRAREDVIRYEKNQQLQAKFATRSWQPMTGGGAGGGPVAGTWTSTGPGTSTAGSGSYPLGGRGGQYGAGTGDGGGSAPENGIPAHDVSTGRFATDDEVHVDGLPDGISLVPLNRCIDEGRVRSAADFDSGKATAEDCVWAARTLYRDLLPRMSRGGDVMQRLRDTDAGRGLVGNQSLQATFRGFFGETGIQVDELPDGTYDVRNGAHRIWAAQQVGVTHLPATVRRRSR